MFNHTNTKTFSITKKNTKNIMCTEFNLFVMP